MTTPEQNTSNSPEKDANQSLADRRRFELEDTQWLAFNAGLKRPVASPASKALLHTLLSAPSILE